MFNKYNAKKASSGGYSFQSQGERDCFDMLTLLEKAGELEKIELQVHVYLTRARILYIADFKIFDTKLEEPVWIEFKGFKTPIWMIKKRLWSFYGPGRLRIYQSRGLKCSVVEEIIPKT